MSRFLALRDRRLKGGVPAREQLYIINTDLGTPLSRAFSEINATARWHGNFHTMFIFCHGYAGQSPGAQMSIDAGGMGLELGSEDLLHSNVARWRAIKGRAQNIVIYACAAASTLSENIGTNADGRYLMGALALNTGAHVYAGDLIQWYTKHANLSNGRFEFGAWEGQLLHFPPDGRGATIVPTPPIEFAQIMHASIP